MSRLEHHSKQRYHFPPTPLPWLWLLPTPSGTPTGKNHAIPQTSFSLALNCDSPWPDISGLFPPWRSHPLVTLGCIPQRILKHLFLRLLQKRVSLGEMLGQKSSLCHHRTHNTHLARPRPVPGPQRLAPSLPPKAAHLSSTQFVPPCPLLYLLQER